MKISLTMALPGRRPIAQVGDDRSVDHADFGELPSMIKAMVTAADSGRSEFILGT